MGESLAYIRRLTALLVISGSLNIILIAVMFYWNIRERPPTPYFELKPAAASEEQIPLAVDHSDSEVIRYFRRMPIEWLVSRLNNTQLVENGYTQRDLALASLVAFYHFDLDRALADIPVSLQKRIIRYGQFRDGTPADLIVFPGLSDRHFDAIVKFAAAERWPLTAKGLFLALQKEDKGARDQALVDMFIMTPEFNLVEMLFSRNSVPVDREDLLTLVLEGEWSHVMTFAQQQKARQDLSVARRQAFLLEAIHRKSKAAAILMLKTDGSFAARKLDDNQVLEILNLTEEKTAEGEQFALTVLTSPRSDEVLKLAAVRLYQYAREVPPEKDVVTVALTRFAPGKARSFIEISQKSYDNAIPTTVKERPSTPVNVAPTPSSPPKSIAATQPQKIKIQLPKPNPSPSVSQRQLLPKRQDRMYIVQEGDSLWKISRKFNVDMEVIRAYNQLDNDTLRPGRSLKIPSP